MKSRIQAITNQFGLNIDSDWLSDCISYIQQHSNPEEEFKRQILYSDLCDFVCKSDTHKRMVQVLDIQEIGISGQQQIETLKQGKVIPRKTLKLKLTDGIQTFYGVELEPIANLELVTPLGVKGILLGAINPVVLLNNQNIKVVGGELASMNTKDAKERIEEYYRQKLGIPKVLKSRAQVSVSLNRPSVSSISHQSSTNHTAMNGSSASIHRPTISNTVINSNSASIHQPTISNTVGHQQSAALLRNQTHQLDNPPSEYYFDDDLDDDLQILEVIHHQQVQDVQQIAARGSFNHSIDDFHYDEEIVPVQMITEARDVTNSVQKEEYFDDDLDDTMFAQITEQEFQRRKEDVVLVEEVKKPKMEEYEIEDCDGFIGIRWVHARVLKISKIQCKQEFLLPATIGNGKREVDVVFGNSFVQQRLGFDVQTLLEKRGTREERDVKKALAAFLKDAGRMEGTFEIHFDPNQKTILNKK